VIGEKLARQCGWSTGMHPSPHDGVTGRETEIHLVGTIRAAIDTPFADSIAIAHYEYLDRLADESRRDRVAGIIVRPRDAVGAGVLAARIDEQFAHADPPTETQQSGDSESGLQRFGKVAIVLGWVMAATCACFALVMVSVMSHAAAERRAMSAMLRVLGFRRRFLLTCFAVEFGLLMVAGVAFGAVAGLAFVAWAAPWLDAVVGAFAVPRWVWLLLPPVFAATLLGGLLAPAAIFLLSLACRYRLG
jgi:ABC-type lipoprotein release transport system permease subunit